MQGRFVRAAGLRVGAAEREVDGAADLLVEQDLADGAVDARVRADAELADAAGAVVGGERRLQDLVSALRARRDDGALPELEFDPGDLDAARARGDVEPDAALGRRLDGAGEYL